MKELISAAAAIAIAMGSLAAGAGAAHAADSGWSWAWTTSKLGLVGDGAVWNGAPEYSSVLGGTTFDVATDAQVTERASLLVPPTGHAVGPGEPSTDPSGVTLPISTANAPGSPTGTVIRGLSVAWAAEHDPAREYAIDLLGLPGAVDWQLTGKAYVPGADAQSGEYIGWTTSPAAGTADVSTTDDGLLRFRNVTTVSGWGPELMVWAQTADGFAIQIGLATRFNEAAVPASPIATDKVVELAPGQNTTVDLIVGATFPGADPKVLTPEALSLPGNAVLSASGLIATGTTPGDEAQAVFALTYTQPQSGGTFRSNSATVTIRTVMGPPRADSLDPDHGPDSGGTDVTIDGDGFDETCLVYVDGQATSTSFVAASTILFVTPAHAAGPVDVHVVCEAGSTDDLPYTYEPSGPPPGGDPDEPDQPKTLPLSAHDLEYDLEPGDSLTLTPAQIVAAAAEYEGDKVDLVFALADAPTGGAVENADGSITFRHRPDGVPQTAAFFLRDPATGVLSGVATITVRSLTVDDPAPASLASTGAAILPLGLAALCGLAAGCVLLVYRCRTD